MAKVTESSPFIQSYFAKAERTPLKVEVSAGIENVERLYEKAYGLIYVLFNTFKDGFQVKDIAALPQIWGLINDVQTILPLAQSEVKLARKGEIERLVYSLGGYLRTLVKDFVPTTKKQAKGVKNIVEVIKNMVALYTLINESLKDGYQHEDLAKLPQAVGHIQVIASSYEDFLAEIKELSPDEVIEIGTVLGVEIYNIIAS
jgi:hypothetical protein